MEVLHIRSDRRRGLAVCATLIGLAGCASYKPVPLDQVPFMERAETQEVVCDFCGQDYQIGAREMRGLLDASAGIH